MLRSAKGLLFSALNLDGEAGSLLCQYSRGEFELKEASNGEDSPVNMLFYCHISSLHPKFSFSLLTLVA